VGQVRSLANDGAAVLLVTHNVIEAERSVDRLAILDHGRVLTGGHAGRAQGGDRDELRLELVLDSDAGAIEAPQFTGPHVIMGNRIVATVPTRLAGEAATWARDLRQTGRIEEFSLAPATLEDAYVALVGATSVPTAHRRRPMSALRSYRLLVIWQARRMRMFLPLGIVVQALFAFGSWPAIPPLPTMDRTTILYLATGGPVIALITMGLVAVPQLVSAAKTEGTLAYMRSLPIPRLVYLLADMTVWLVVVLPGVVFAVIIARSVSAWTCRSARSWFRP